MTIKKIVNIAVVAGLVLTLLILYLNIDFSSKKTEDKSLSMRSAPVRQMSGTFIVPAGKGPEETKIWINLKEIVWLAAEPETKLLDAKNGRVIKVYSNGWTSPPTKKRGHLIFMKGQVPINVKYKIIN